MKIINRLRIYSYTGFNERGHIIRGKIQAANLVIAKIILRKQGIKIKKIYHNIFNFSFFDKRISVSKIILFTNQLAILLTAGIPMMRAFDIIIKNINHKTLLPVVMHIRDNIQIGHSLSESLQHHPQCFDQLYCNLIATGEQTGQLDNILSKLVIYLEKMHAVKSKLIKALIYPAVIMIVALIVFGILLFNVMPQFEILFKNFGAELPLYTQMIIAISHWIHRYIFLFGLILLLVAVIAQMRAIKLKNFLQQLSFKIPVIKNMKLYAAITRFSNVLAITHTAGIPLMAGLKASAQVIGNNEFSQEIVKIGEDINKGDRLYQAISKSNIFPDMVVQMIMIGEESGTLAEILIKVARYYEQLLDNYLSNITSLLEPIIIAILGILIGGLVIGMYLPIFKLGNII